MERLGTDALLLSCLSLCLLWGAVQRGQAGPLEPGVSVARGQISLNDMLKEVEQLMEDTQHKLEEAVHQMQNETSRDLYGYSLPSIFQNQNLNTTKTLETDGPTGDSPFSKSIFEDGRWNEVDHECLIDEDCEQDSYCLYNISSSNCVPCKFTNMECVKDEECCGEQLCVWGLCVQNKTRGQSGTICQAQSDCSPQHCCAFHKALLFPVCRPRPQQGQGCREQQNQLLELMLWDDEAPREHCPCTTGLECQPVGQESLCMKNKSSLKNGP
ncbi:dickkopf-related protein 3-like [Astyanax mexicanus]|uniref:Dickkopf-related protein 3-like n=2 Tax=Astyanax mexicanus TaxID=7994 RepID=A0A8B9KS39_ASTMX|nr:dickkopf-related protein 3-like [Astyanax mexicanus]